MSADEDIMNRWEAQIPILWISTRQLGFEDPFWMISKRPQEIVAHGSCSPFPTKT
jgi:hypothetical protein